MNLPLVSVIMPAYNAASYIADAIASVRAQTYGNWELIITNDGSTDDTDRLVKDYAQQEPRIVYLKQPNRGQAAARNRCLREARGELCALHDADDGWEAHMLETLIPHFEQYRADVVYSNVALQWEGTPDPGDPMSHVTDLGGGMATGPHAGKAFFESLYQSNQVVTQTAIVRKEWMERVNGFDERLDIKNCEDYDLWLRIAQAGAVFYGDARILGIYRKHPHGSIADTVNMCIPEMEVALKHFNLGYVSEKALIKKNSWLYQVIINYLVVSHRWTDLKRVLSRGFRKKYHIQRSKVNMAYEAAIFWIKWVVRKFVKK